FRFRHATTRKYLCVFQDSGELLVSLSEDATDPHTVFKMHPVLQETAELKFESYARIEHVITGSWLHAIKDKAYQRREFLNMEDEKSMKALRWDGGDLREVTCCSDRRYDDAYTIKKVAPAQVADFNFVAGMVPFLQELIAMRRNGSAVACKDSYKICQALRELRSFMLDGAGEPRKARQKLLRNLRVIDLLVLLLKIPLTGPLDEHHFGRVFSDAYDILHTYMLGNSRKNALYFAKYIEFFQTQMVDKSDLALKVTKMLVELMKDNRKIVDRISKEQIDDFVNLLRKNEHYNYLKLLKVLCVCNGVAITDNQSYIAQKWLLEDTHGIYLTERGQNIDRKPNETYVSTDQMKTWCPLVDFVQPDENDQESVERCLFLRTQLDLFIALCHGRNEECIRLITKDLSYLTWEEAFLGLSSESLPQDFRAKYCEIIIGLFVNVGHNYSVVESPQLSFIYEYVGTKDSGGSSPAPDQYAAKDLITIFPVIRDWIAQFLDQNRCMVASQMSNNLLIEKVLSLLVNYYGGVDELAQLLPPLRNLLNGESDVPFPPDIGRDYSKDSKKLVQKFKHHERYKRSPETLAIVRAKHAALRVLDLVMTFQENARLASFVSKFKECEVSESSTKKKHIKPMVPALYESFDSLNTKRSAKSKQNAIKKELRAMFDESSRFLDVDSLTGILIDLANYEYDDMVQLSLQLLNKLYSSKSTMFQQAINSLVLITPDSCRVHRELSKQVPLLRMMTRSKWTAEQALKMQTILGELCDLCHLPKAEEEPHPMNQRLMISHNVLQVIFDILATETDANFSENSAEIASVLRKAVKLLRALTLHYDDVQTQVFNNLDNLLKVRMVEPELALALKEVFANNQELCLKVLPKQILKIVYLVSECQERAPEFLELLSAIVKVEGTGLALKRNQTLVMKYVMQNYSRVAYILEQCSAKDRMEVLNGNRGVDHCQYLISFIDLLATCAEGENRYIESLCQTILSAEEILNILNDPNVENHLKKPFLRYFFYAYMKSASGSGETRSLDILHDNQIWDLIDHISRELLGLAYWIRDDAEKDTRFYELDEDKDYQREKEIFDRMTASAVEFCAQLSAIVVEPRILTQMLMESVVENIGKGVKLQDTVAQMKSGNKEYYENEIVLNTKLKTLAVNASLLWGGHNTVRAQLKFNSDREYTQVGSDEALPLDEEFQSHVRCLVNMASRHPEQRYKLANQLVNGLRICATSIASNAASNSREVKLRQEQERLTIRILQILRAFMHNEERKLPEDWEVRTSEFRVKKGLRTIADIQNTLNGFGIVKHALPHLASNSSLVAKEVLSLLGMMLFHANEKVQESMLYYFLHTKEEVFFYAVRNRLQLSTANIKERRLLISQQKARELEAKGQAENLRATMTLGVKALEQIRQYQIEQKIEQASSDLTRRVSLSQIQSRNRKRKRPTSSAQPPQQAGPSGASTGSGAKNSAKSKKKVAFANGTSAEGGRGGRAAADTRELLVDDAEEFEQQQQSGSPEETISMKRWLHRSGAEGPRQHLRRAALRPASTDNIKSGQIARTRIWSSTWLATPALRAAATHAHELRIYDNKIIDYINFILRTADFDNCEPEQVVELRQTIANLVISLIEENSAEAIVIAREVKDTLDKKALYRVMTECYEAQQSSKKSTGFNRLVEEDKELREAVYSVGFSFYTILARLYDIDPTIAKKELQITELQQKAFKFFKKNSMTIEILKNDNLQKIHFRVKNKNVLREELKEKLKWNVDRTSPSTKVRDFMDWTKAILKDIQYQKKVLSNPFTILLTRFWLIWNHCATLTAVILNILMLIGIESSDTPTTLKPHPWIPALEVNETARWKDDYPNLHLWMDSFSLLLMVLSFIILLAFFVANHPQLPNVRGLFERLRRMRQKKTEDEEEFSDTDSDGDKLSVSLFSIPTLYYIIFFFSALAGTFYRPYFFAFHLLNIVNNNQLLQGVIQAVTMNGLSLIWVSVLGIAIMYLFSVIAFAQFRHAFPGPNNLMFCRDLHQCFISVLRFGLIGDLFDNLVPEDAAGEKRSFDSFLPVAIFHIAFFILITTVGLNIIFGIIVDTFSELRNMKWTAEVDMRDNCFICSRNSYDFEHHGMGFDYHVRQEHNMWAYIFFFIHLEDTARNDYTSLDLHVYKLLAEEKYDFFPLNRALCLSAKDEDSTDSKIDELLHYVKNLVSHQKKEEAERKRWVELNRQRKWQRRVMGGAGVPGHNRESSCEDEDNFLSIPRVASYRQLNQEAKDRQATSSRNSEDDYKLTMSKEDLIQGPAAPVVEEAAAEQHLGFLDEYDEDGEPRRRPEQPAAPRNEDQP
uniref:RYDR_ITPR domain-containing protein n=1 Tax=Macrostomum lignano TaxID=282301 RepID=A0A1I8HB99_9PLAT